MANQGKKRIILTESSQASIISGLPSNNYGSITLGRMNENDEIKF